MGRVVCAVSEGERREGKSRGGRQEGSQVIEEVAYIEKIYLR